MIKKHLKDKFEPEEELDFEEIDFEELEIEEEPEDCNEFCGYHPRSELLEKFSTWWRTI